MTKQFSNDDGNGTLLLILAGIFASCLLLASLVAFAGWRFYRSLEVANKDVAVAERADLQEHPHSTQRTVPDAIERRNAPPRQPEPRRSLVEDAGSSEDSKIGFSTDPGPPKPIVQKVEPAESKEVLKFESVKNAPESSNLKRFNFNK